MADLDPGSAGQPALARLLARGCAGRWAISVSRPCRNSSSRRAAGPTWPGSIAAASIVIVEIKTSLADLRADRKWPEYRDFCDVLLFAVLAGFPLPALPTPAC